MTSRILIAEDEPFIVESITFLLKREGHSVTAVSDGKHVLDAIHRDQPNLLILDVMMPSSNGFDILRQIRATAVLKTLPVLVLTAKGQEADRRRMLELGANAFMTKPFSNAGLIDAVDELLNIAINGNGGEATG